jgi:riboflavin biosynthesis pyrimidine reductase
MSDVYPGRRGEFPLTDDDLIAAYATDRSRPCLRVNFVTSIDGAVTGTEGYSEALSAPADKRVFNLLRMMCDALLVGAGTLRREGYNAIRLDPQRRSWRLEHGLAEFPTLVVVSRSLDLDPRQEAFADAPVRPIVLTTEVSRPERRKAMAEVAHVLVYGEVDVDLAASLDVLHGFGLGQILCEGGPHLLAALSRADLVDEMCLTLSPLLVGPGPGRITAGAPEHSLRHMVLRHAFEADCALLLRYVRISPPHDHDDLAPIVDQPS